MICIMLSPWRPFGNLSLLVKYSNAMFILCLNSLPWNNLMDIVDCIFHFHMSTTWISPERDKILRNRKRFSSLFRNYNLQRWKWEKRTFFSCKYALHKLDIIPSCFSFRFGFKLFFTFASVLILASMVTIAALVGDEDSYPVAGIDT